MKIKTVSPTIVKVYVSGVATGVAVALIAFVIKYLSLTWLIPATIFYGVTVIATHYYISQLFKAVYHIDEREREAVEFANEIIDKYSVINTELQ